MFYGDMSILRLCKRVNLNVSESMCTTLVKDFRIYKENPKHISTSLKELVNSIEIVPISTAECERGFSAMNLTLTDQTNHLEVTTLSNLLLFQ